MKKKRRREIAAMAAARFVLSRNNSATVEYLQKAQQVAESVIERAEQRLEEHAVYAALQGSAASSPELDFDHQLRMAHRKSATTE